MQARKKTFNKVLSTPGHLINIAARGFARLSEARLKPLGFGVGHVPVLVALSNRQSMTQRELAQFARIEQPSMAQMLARMERDGLIRRIPDPSDGRSSLVSLSEEGETRMPEACKTLFQGNREALNGFTAEEAEQFVKLLMRLIANLDRIAGLEESSQAEKQSKLPSQTRMKRQSR